MRKKVIQIRLTELEHQVLLRAVGDEPFSTWCRNKLLGDPGVDSGRLDSIEMKLKKLWSVVKRLQGGG